MGSTIDQISGLRELFPALRRVDAGRELVYLDSAASTLRTTVVMEAERHFGSTSYANVHRGVYRLAQEADAAYERSRRITQQFLGARYSSEIIFTSGTTAGINLIAQGWGGVHLNPGDEILLTLMEHHANIVPWRIVANKTGATIKVVPLLADGSIAIEAVRERLTPRTKIFAFTHVSNVLGTVNPVAEFCALAREVGAVTVVDGAQAVSHEPIDVQKLGADFYLFSGHKVFGPTGIGVLFGRRELLAALPPLLGGGGMIDTVSFEKVTYAEPPSRFEAGTPPIVQAVGLAAALELLMTVGVSSIGEYLAPLAAELQRALASMPGVRVFGSAPAKAGICAFEVEGVHPHDVATVLAGEGVCVRAGHHCCMPLMESLRVPALSRASLALYNRVEDIERLVKAVHRAQVLLG
jgi:cysteine desulfurase/selenocysteine lyase